MRIAFALLVFTSCLTYGTATFGLLKSNINAAPEIRPAAKYQAVNYLPSPIVVPERLPVTYTRPVPTYTAHVSTYSVSLPAVGKYSTPVSSYGSPHAHESTYSAPAVIYAVPYTTVAYETAPHVHYPVPETVYAEPISAYAAHLIEEHYDDHYANQAGTW